MNSSGTVFISRSLIGRHNDYDYGYDSNYVSVIIL